MFPNKWIGRSGPALFPARSLEFNMFGLLFLGKNEGTSLFSTSYHFGKHERNNDSRVRKSPNKLSTKITSMFRSTCQIF